MNGNPAIGRHPTSWPVAVAVAALATALTLLAMFWTRSAFQIRTLPERVMEWALLFVPPAQFEAIIGQFGFDAKVYALYAAVTGMALLLGVLGAVALRRASSPWMAAATAPLLYLLAMAGVMPLTEGGLFGAALPQDPWLVNACYLAVALTYASVLLGGSIAARALGVVGGGTSSALRDAGGVTRGSEPTSASGAPARLPILAAMSSRRAMLTLLPATLAAYALVLWRGRAGAGRGGDLPLARIGASPAAPVAAVPPAGVTTSPTAAPQPVGAPTVAATQGTTATSAPAASPNVAQATPPAAPTSTGVSGTSAATPAASAPASPTPQPDAPAAPTGAPAEPTAVASAPEPPAAPVAAPSADAQLPPGTFSKQVERGEDGSLTKARREPGTLAPLITPTGSFYYVTKNAVSDPAIQPDAWRLAIDGAVNAPVQLDYRTLRQLPAVEITKTLECISNYVVECELVPFGCDLISTAVWRGVSLKDVLDLAGGTRPGVARLTLLSADEFSSTIPLEVALDPGTILAYEMNGQPLPYEHGYPARVLASGRYGYKSAKWIVGIRPTTDNPLDWYGRRNWNREGVVKTMVRIDEPASGARLPAGAQRVAGIAYGGDRGISGVEISPDGGQSWAPVRLLEPAPGKDAWVRWEGSLDVQPGATLRVVARATDGAGALQSSEFVLPAPDGASGWNAIRVVGG